MAIAAEPQAVAANPAFRTGWILNPRADLFWFLALPFIAVAAGLASQQWLPAVALASATLWITVPHHFATWLRTFGFSEDWRRFKDQLIVGPIVICGLSFLGLIYAPLTLIMVGKFWDLQHSLMQQHGFARIYDFKAKAGANSTRHWDLALSWLLFTNLVITAPLFSNLWVRELYRFGLSLSASQIETMRLVSYGVLGVFSLAYIAHAVSSVRRGYPLNPIKYAFLGSSYFLWYFTAWQTASLMVFTIAHVIMHGFQYIVMVYFYLRRKADQTTGEGGFVRAITRPRNIWAFVLICAVYAVLYQFIIGRPFGDFGFGVVTFMMAQAGPPDANIGQISQQTGRELFALAVIQSVTLLHFYYDSFIWKVRDKRTQGGL